MSQHYEIFRAAVIYKFQSGFVKDSTLPVPSPDQDGDTDNMFIPYELPNHRINQPDGVPWARLTIREGRRIGLEVTGKSYRTPGVMYLQIFLPEETGTQVARNCADLMTDIFQNTLLELPNGVVRFREVSFIGGLGVINGFDSSNVEVEFQWDQYN